MDNVLNKGLRVALLLSLLLLVACSDENIYTTANATRCTTQSVGVMLQVNCDNGTVFTFTAPTSGVDGVNGTNGTNGLNAQGIVVVDPCGDLVGQVDEVLLVFPDNSVLAWYQGVGFVVLAHNTTYQTTDGQSCVFQVDSQGNVQ